MAKQCIVRINGKRCPNPAKSGSRSCCQHGQRRRAAKSTGGRARFVHLDCRVPDPLVALEPLAASDVIEIEVRDNQTIVGLPTNRPQMLTFLRNWLARAGNTLADIERLTPAQLRPAPLMANAYAAAADSLVRYDLAGVRHPTNLRGLYHE